MKLLIESGATKTDWALINSVDIPIIWQSKGILPLQSDQNQLNNQFADSLAPYKNQYFDHIIYYGTGIKTEKEEIKLITAIKSVVRSPKINVYSDIYAVAHALSNNKPCLVGILGTGSNLAYYNGSIIEDKRLSLGFILGDEGSGFSIGRTFMKAYLEKTMPQEIAKEIQSQLTLTPDELVRCVYENERPAAFVASFLKYILPFEKHKWTQNQLRNSLNNYIKINEKFFKKYPHLQLFLVGGISFHFSNLIHEICEENSIILGSIIKKPLDALIHKYSY